MNKVHRAVALFEDGFLCSQAILAVFGADYGLARETALKLAAGLGGGMAGKGQTCGGVLVLGLAKGHSSVEDEASKMATYGAVYDYLSRFEQAHGTVNCSDLLGCDLGTPEGYAAAKEGKLFATLCPKFVATAAELLEQMLSES